MALFLKENALKRAEELINVEQKQGALQTLHDVITSKRYRSWQEIQEKIMFKYVELCVDLRKGQFAKDGLIHYRIICQQVNVGSLEEVVKRFIHLSTEKAEKACSQAREMEQALDVDDLEADKRPEDLLKCYVSEEKGKDRSDRELVTARFKFLWETYRIVLEVLRNNSKFEALYAMTAYRALQFCKQYKRKTEFRRLCEILRNHLANLNKYPDQRDRPDLSAPESLQLYLDTRFEQLKIATELELWKEAFRSVEDIHGLMCMAKKTLKPSLMTVYYATLIEIFWISSSHLYHAYAWFKLFLLQKSFNKDLSQKDLEFIASSVVLAALSVPPHDRNLELEHEKERNLRMANLIGFNLKNKMNSSKVLSRSSLLAELASKGVMSCVAQEVKDIYYLLENKFLPSDFALKVPPLLNKISKLGGKFSFASSVPEVQLSQYVPALKKLATLRLLQQVSNVYQTMKVENLAGMMPFSDFSVVEKISVDAVNQKFLSMKVDHMKKVVIFCKKSLEADGLRDHLASSALNKAREMISPPDRKQSKLGPLLPSLLEVVAKDHKILLARKSIIEKRKEVQERKPLETEQEEESKEAAEQRQLLTVFNSEHRRNQRIHREIAEREHEEAERHRNEELNLTNQLRMRQEMEKKLKKLSKTMDFLERAKREESAPLIEAAYQQRLVEERILHEREQQQEAELKERLSHRMENKIFEEKVFNRRKVEFNRLGGEREESRKQEREKMRKLKHYLRLEEQRQQKLNEEEEARKHEEAERKKKEETERLAKLAEILEKQRQREREVEEKAEKQKREALAGKPNEPALRPYKPPPARRSLESDTAAPATSSAPAPGKYIPKFRRGGA
ncbi:eukaryotic translation initiation factor 3 subunit A isoform X2 [Medicago truncatula]|uniref:Eukaryotic translation initiation factor 3 subunit A n=1 Tax=Medicago truncatula TaxID=3880 RepID=G7L2M2_MEDTR|nr:eukaryotic translation initiation factor 3 subunit A isoform X2 [Medicago truncatula]AES80980.2 eukaryotic translation initiation factor 3a [Medicago truncatula]